MPQHWKTQPIPESPELPELPPGEGVFAKRRLVAHIQPVGFTGYGGIAQWMSETATSMVSLFFDVVGGAIDSASLDTTYSAPSMVWFFNPGAFHFPPVVKITICLSVS